MKFLNVFLCLSVLAVTPSFQSEGISITHLAKWEESPDLRIIDREVRFRSRTMLDDLTLLPKIIIDVTFKNIGDKIISDTEFDFLFYSKDSSGVDEKEIRYGKAKSLFYKTPVLPNKTGSFRYELSSDKFASISKVVVRISQITYNDGSVWKKTVMPALDDKEDGD